MFSNSCGAECRQIYHEYVCSCCRRVMGFAGRRLERCQPAGCVMRDILNPIAKWWDSGETFGLATLVRTYRSAPREAGAALAVSAGGEVIGSISGGCVEGAVYELASEVIQTGVPVLQTYGVSDDDAFAVGLTCGGILDVFVERVDAQTFAELPRALDAIENRRSVAVASVISAEPA